MDISEGLIELLDGDEDFPVGEGVKVIAGKTLFKNLMWHKAILLVETYGKIQIRLYAWQFMSGVPKVRQKFNVAKSYSPKIAEILYEFYENN